MKHTTLNTLLRMALGACISTSSALIAMELNEKNAWANIEQALESGALKHAKRCEEIQNLIASHPSLYAQCVKYMAQEHTQLLACELWLLKASLDQCKKDENEFAGLKPQTPSEIGNLKGLVETLEEKEEGLGERINRLTNKKAELVCEIVTRPSISHMFSQNITKLKAKIAKRTTQQSLAHAIKADIASLLEESTPRETPQPAHDVVHLLRKQASYDKSLHQ